MWKSRKSGGLLSAAFALVVQGCAVQVGPNGHRVVGVDQAELLGRKTEIFTLPGGATGALRAIGSQYSLKLDQYFRVLPIGQAKTVRVVKVEQVGDRSTVLVEISDNSCDYRYQLFSIKEDDVLTWNFYGDCKTPATLMKVENEQQFDFRSSYQVTRFTHRDSRFFRRDIPLSKPQQVMPSTPPIAAVSRSRPGPPSAGAAITSRDPVRRSPPAGRTAQPQRPVQAAPLPAKLEFPAEEQKATRIVLDK